MLELSKLIMYDFFYGVIKKQYGNKATLLYCDTDSYILEILSDNFYNDIKQNISHYDTSNYKVDNIHQIPITPSVIGLMKDEMAGKIIWNFIGTGSKAYIVNCEGNLSPKAKGIPYHISSKLNKYDRLQGSSTQSKGIYIKKI